MLFGQGGCDVALELQRQVKDFVLRNFLFTDDDKALANGDSLIRGGIVDSTGILELVGHLEQAFAIRIPPEDMTPANFDSIDTIGAYLARRLAT